MFPPKQQWRHVALVSITIFQSKHGRQIPCSIIEGIKLIKKTLDKKICQLTIEFTVRACLEKETFLKRNNWMAVFGRFLSWIHSICLGNIGYIGYTGYRFLVVADGTHLLYGSHVREQRTCNTRVTHPFLRNSSYTVTIMESVGKTEFLKIFRFCFRWK